MKLKSIRALGFKSFADKVDLEFKTSITAIVGPNGSGKSNIVDAVRWVLGEQSVKSLRGSGSMSDVIFSGSETRPPFKRAEVSLTFDNTVHYLNTDLVDVEVKRILYYTGENEYFINNAKVRLKDITNLFLDSGIGNDSFNIISQGNIESIVNSKPQDRRVILESAAGVLKYKTRKLESMRKLEKTKDNIEKVDLVIQELEENVHALQGQSELAQKYLGFKEELEDLEIALTTYDITELNREYEKVSAEVKRLEEEKEQLEFKNGKDTSSMEKLKVDLLHLEEEIAQKNSEFILVNDELSKLNSQKTLFLERQDYEVDAEKLNESFLKLKETELSLQKNRESLLKEKMDLENKLKSYHEEKASLEEKMSLFAVKYGSLKNDLEQKRKVIFALQNQIEILETNLENDVTLPYSVKNVLNNPRLTGIHNTIGKVIETDPEYVVALDVALASSSNFIITSDENSAKKAITYLKENKLGRATFFPMSVIKPRELPLSVIEKAQGVPGFIGVLSDLVRYDKIYDAIIKNQLGTILVAKDLDACNQLGALLEYKYRVVSLEGDILHTGGSLTGGSLKKQNSSFKMKQELDSKKEELASATKSLHSYEDKMKEYEEEKSNQDVSLGELDKTITITAELIYRKNITLKDAEAELEEVRTRIEGAEQVKENKMESAFVALLEQIKDKELLKENLERTIENLKKDKSDLSSRIASLEQEYRLKNSVYHKVEQELRNYEVTLGKYDTKMDYLLNLLSESYELTYEKAKREYTLEIEVELARTKVTYLRKEMNALGDVNLGSIKEYERVSSRYNFLQEQKTDLEKASAELLGVIDEMDEIMVERLKTVFDKIEKEFAIVFKKMFKGGNGMLRLTDPENILETGIEIVAEPPGKKLNSIALLSGGEKTLTAISLLFAILNVYPVPFCILDEVEAALDEANVDTFGRYLQSQQDKSEFILITHKKRTMEYAGTLYGITMQEQGVSKVVSVRLESREEYGQ